MLFFFLACAVPPSDTAVPDPPLATFTIEVGAEPGAMVTAEAEGRAAAGETLVIEIVDRAHPARLQSSVCATDDPVLGCATLDWSIGPPRLSAGADVFLHPDLSLSTDAPPGEGTVALGGITETFTGPMPVLVDGTWTVELPLVYLSGNAPDGLRNPAELVISLRAR